MLINNLFYRQRCSFWKVSCLIKGNSYTHIINRCLKCSRNINNFSFFFFLFFFCLYFSFSLFVLFFLFFFLIILFSFFFLIIFLISFRSLSLICCFTYFIFSVNNTIERMRRNQEERRLKEEKHGKLLSGC